VQTFALYVQDFLQEVLYLLKLFASYAQKFATLVPPSVKNYRRTDVVKNVLKPVENALKLVLLCNLFTVRQIKFCLTVLIVVNAIAP
jgi:hypothetical protein